MRVFVTGASGLIGTATVADLVAAGHEVVGLARSDTSAAALVAAGAAVRLGSLDDPTGLAEGAAASDGVIHLAYNHDFSQMMAAIETDRTAIAAMGDALAGSDRPFVVAGGILGLVPGQVAVETYAPEPTAPTHPRTANAIAAIALADRGVRSSVVRLAPTVHTTIKRGFVGNLIDIARETGVAGYLGDGSARWPALNVLDAGPLFRLALEKAPAGSYLHGIGEEGVPVIATADLIGRRLGVPVRQIPDADAAAHFGFLAGFLALDSPASSALTQQLLGWKPTHPGLLADVETWDLGA